MRQISESLHICVLTPVPGARKIAGESVASDIVTFWTKFIHTMTNYPKEKSYMEFPDNLILSLS